MFPMRFSSATVLNLTLFLCAASAVCDYRTSAFPPERSVPVSHFSYTGLTGPLNWYGLNKTANVLCAKGSNQSPIVISDANLTATNGSELSLMIPPYPEGSAFENLGTTVEVVVNGTLVDGNKTYSLTQFHFHTPSEHRLEEEYSVMEAHFVFQAPDKSLAVLAFFIALGLIDPLLGSVFSSISEITTPGDATLTGPLDFSTLQAQLTTSDAYRYTGSLTTPPCSEGVRWIISASPLYVDETTFDSVKAVLKFNARYTQNILGDVNLLMNAANLLNKS